jgi:hypothetical protein
MKTPSMKAAWALTLLVGTVCSVPGCGTASSPSASVGLDSSVNSLGAPSVMSAPPRERSPFPDASGAITAKVRAGPDINGNVVSMGDQKFLPTTIAVLETMKYNGFQINESGRLTAMMFNTFVDNRDAEILAGGDRFRWVIFDRYGRIKEYQRYEPANERDPDGGAEGCYVKIIIDDKKTAFCEKHEDDVCKDTCFLRILHDAPNSTEFFFSCTCDTPLIPIEDDLEEADGEDANGGEATR